MLYSASNMLASFALVLLGQVHSTTFNIMIKLRLLWNPGLRQPRFHLSAHGASYVINSFTVLVA